MHERGCTPVTPLAGRLEQAARSGASEQASLTVVRHCRPGLNGRLLGVHREPVVLVEAPGLHEAPCFLYRFML